MARPRKADDTKRSRPVGVKYTPAEYARLVEEAERLGVASVSELVRQRSLTGRVVVQKRAELAAPDRVELNRLGVNLHQLVKHLNFERGRSNAIAAVADEAEGLLKQINALLLASGPDGS